MGGGGGRRGGVGRGVQGGAGWGCRGGGGQVLFPGMKTDGISYAGKTSHRLLLRDTATDTLTVSPSPMAITSHAAYTEIKSGSFTC